MSKHTSFVGGHSWWKTWGLRLGLLLIAAAVVLLATTSSGQQESSRSPSTDTADISLPSFGTNGESESQGAAPDALDGSEPAESGPDGYEPFTDLPPVNVADLPSEAWDTLDLISQSGPYPFSKDDSVFQNREGILPDQPRGYYREYTVITPGADNRGARRIVAGEGGELFYTEDHYNSFSEIGFS